MNIIKRTNYPIMFDEFFNDFFNVKEMNIPPYNIMESDDNFQIEFSVPGSNKKDFQIEIENDYLKVSKEKKESNISHNYSRQQFDYNFHQAMFEAPSSDYKEGVIIEVVQPGYVLHDRLIRPAMVGVSKGEAVENEKKEEKDE